MTVKLLGIRYTSRFLIVMAMTRSENTAHQHRQQDQEQQEQQVGHWETAMPGAG
jgi:hypothetical protein